MTRDAYVKDLQALEGEVLELGGRVSDARSERGCASSKTRDQVGRLRADRRRRMRSTSSATKIEEHCLKLLATQQPMAGDLRRVTAVLHVASDLERMGDQAEGIGKIVLLLGTAPLIKPLIDIPKLTGVVLEMLDSGDGGLLSMGRGRGAGDRPARRRGGPTAQRDRPRPLPSHGRGPLQDHPGHLPDVGRATT